MSIIRTTPLGAQAKLLRALQGGEVQRVGADRPIRADVGILTATTRDLVHDVAQDRFRADLYHRRDVFSAARPAAARGPRRYRAARRLGVLTSR